MCGVSGVGKENRNPKNLVYGHGTNSTNNKIYSYFHVMAERGVPLRSPVRLMSKALVKMNINTPET